LALPSTAVNSPPTYTDDPSGQSVIVRTAPFGCGAQFVTSAPVELTAASRARAVPLTVVNVPPR
jgi:hypothetical protein